MQRSTWAFALDEATDLSTALDEAGDGSVGQAAPSALRRTWLDTFDWRLFGKGFTLESSEADGQTTLILQRASTGAVVASAPATRAPRRPEDLPPGRLRDEVTRLAGVRALLPVGSVSLARRTWPMLDDEGKTVARVHWDLPADQSGASAAPRLEVVALRGYSGEAARVARGLSGRAGLRKAQASLALEVIAAGERRPDDKLRIGSGLTPTLAAPAAFGVVLSQLLEAIDDNLVGTIDDVDTEFLHDLRVAVRRSRSAVKLGRDLFDPETTPWVAAELKWLGDATTPLRDLDVFLLHFDELAAQLPAPEELGPLHALLRRHRRRERTRLVRALKSQRFDAFRTSHREWLIGLSAASADDVPIGADAAARIQRLHRRVIRRGRAAAKDPVAERLHDLRKRCKELRYALEFFGPLYGGQDIARVVSELKKLQDVLGAYQDAEVQMSALAGYAKELGDAGDEARGVLAMGRLISELEQRQAQTQAIFGDRFARFDSPGVAKRLRRLSPA